MRLCNTGWETCIYEAAGWGGGGSDCSGGRESGPRGCLSWLSDVPEAVSADEFPSAPLTDVSFVSLDAKIALAVETALIAARVLNRAGEGERWLREEDDASLFLVGLPECGLPEGVGVRVREKDDDKEMLPGTLSISRDSGCDIGSGIEVDEADCERESLVEPDAS
jgi:hypothetical protein